MKVFVFKEMFMIAKEKDKVKMLQFTAAAPLKRVKKKGLSLCFTRIVCNSDEYVKTFITN